MNPDLPSFVARRRRVGWCILCAALSSTSVMRVARAEPNPDRGRYRTPLATSGEHWDVFGSAAYGQGLRLNNPYRLGRVLGSSPESTSLTAGYLDLGVGAVLSTLRPFQHGAVVHLSIAVAGIPQEVLSVSYLGRIRSGRWVGFGRLGVPVILEPDLNMGLEGALGGAWFASAGVALQAEFVGSLFYGAATQDVSPTTIPVLSLELGVCVAYEVLP